MTDKEQVKTLLRAALYGLDSKEPDYFGIGATVGLAESGIRKLFKEQCEQVTNRDLQSV